MGETHKTGLAPVGEAAKYLGVSRHTLRRMVNNKELPYQLVGSRRRIPWSAIYDVSDSQDPAKTLELKISKDGKAAIAETLDRMEAEIAVIRKALKAGGWK